MTVTPDPLDALKYVFVVTWLRVEGIDELADVRDLLEAMVEPFLGEGFDLDDLRYSNGQAVSVASEYEPGRALLTHFLPPGYPTGITSC